MNRYNVDGRWIPVRFAEGRPIELESLIAEVLLLWADGKELFTLNGASYAEAERLSKEAHSGYIDSDPWEDIIESWMNSPAENGKPGKTNRDLPFIEELHLIRNVLAGEAWLSKRDDVTRARNAMRRLGYEHKSRGYGLPSRFERIIYLRARRKKLPEVDC